MRQTQQSFTLFRRIAAVPYLKTAQTGLRQTFDLRIGQQHTVAPGISRVGHDAHAAGGFHRLHHPYRRG